MKGELNNCDECESEYYKESSEMIGLCPDCSHKLYGFPNCEHKFENGKCVKCGWNGMTSEYLKNRENKDEN